MKTLYTADCALDMCQVDFTGHWQPGAIFRAMQNVSSEHCESYGLGYETLRAQGVAWVLTRALVSMESYPELGDRVTVLTWPTANRHSFFPRHYAFEINGRRLGCATALYVLMDLESRRIAPPARLPGTVPDCQIPAPLPLPGNLSVLGGEPETREYTPVYTDYDMNRHVNNTRYIDWFMDSFPYEHHQRRELSQILIHYNREIHPGEPVCLSLKSEACCSVLHGEHEGEACFSIQGTWRNR